jgi:hypothetical protein
MKRDRENTPRVGNYKISRRKSKTRKFQMKKKKKKERKKLA